MASETSRRDAVLLGLGLVAVAAGWQVWIGRPRAFDFQPIEGLPGWRRLAGGEVSGGAGTNLFAGLDESDAVKALDPARLCEVAFEMRGPGVPVAIFTDVNCPFCRVMMPRLAVRAERGEVAVTWLEWPVFGDASDAAARMLLAARAFGREDALRHVLYTTTRIAPARAAAQAGLPPARLRARMDAPEIERHLNDARAAAALLALPGTPAMLIGRTLVIGAVSAADLDRLIALEREAGPLPC